MQKLRSIHLYLGCVFAPMLLFFAISGLWQMFGLNSSGLFQTLSTIHTQHQLKSGDALGSPLMFTFVLLMALSFIVTTILGVVMALKFGGSRRATIYCLAAGVLAPLSLVLIRLLS
ncbi:MAG: hypothetical protein ACXW3L_03175 [Limisphaerales bacterium]